VAQQISVCFDRLLRISDSIRNIAFRVSNEFEKFTGVIELVTYACNYALVQYGACRVAGYSILK